MLHQAIYSQNINLVEYLIDNGLDVNERGNEYKSVLSTAVLTENLKLIKVLLDKGADVKAAKNDWENSPFLEAVHYGKLDVVELFL